MSIVTITPPSDKKVPAPLPGPRTTHDEILLISRDCLAKISQAMEATSVKKKRSQVFFDALWQIYSARKKQLERAALVCERPTTAQFFKEAVSLKNLHEGKTKVLERLATSKKGPSTAMKDFTLYWNKISSGNELEFIGALYLIELLLRPGYLADEFEDLQKSLKWNGNDDERQLTVLESLIAEFSSLSSDRILAGARHGALLILNLFSANTGA